MEKRKQHKKINVLEGLEKEEKKEKEIINLDKEIGIDEETEEMFQEEMESSQENESVLEEEVSENEEILEAQEEIVEENNETEKISEEDSTEEIEEEQEIPLEEDVEDFVIEDSSKPKKKIDGRWFLICILCVLLGIVFYAGFKVFNQYQSQEKVGEVAENKTENKDTTAPVFIGFLDRIVINLNAVDVDYSKYYLAVDNDQQMQVTVTGDVNLSQEGEYPITVSSTDEAGNTTSQDAIVQVISEETMVAVPIELTPMIDGSIPMATDTKQRVDANVIMYYYGEVSQEIKDEIARLGLDVSGYRLDSYWHPSELNI
ncbi:putative uncharacterized protein [Firmicutes bacterium CAG:308]|nr:putative uncharacterized protein [Firmicutes bacterium CAG:308]